MLDKYKEFIRNVLISKDYLDNYLVSNLLIRCIKTDDNEYISQFNNNEEKYYIDIFIYENCITINSKLTRIYLDNGYEEYVKEIYIDEDTDRFFKKGNNIYHSFNKIKKAYLEYEFSALRTTIEEENSKEIYKNINSFNDIKFKNKKVKTKSLF